LFPKVNELFIDTSLEKDFSVLQDAITAIRTIRSENSIPPDKKGRAIIVPASQEVMQILLPHVAEINTFCRLNETEISMTAARPKFCGQAVVMGSQIYLELAGLIDIQVEKDRIAREIAKTQKLADSTKAKLANPSFADKAPKDVVEKENEKYLGILENLDKLKMSLIALGE
jgi:valyl-tRNA synthetase